MDLEPRSRIIERPRLTRLLDETEARTIVLVAPAGYGKTTLARQWLAAGGRSHGWYGATSAAADVAALAAGVARAASEIVPGAGKRMIERLGAESAPVPAARDLAALLVDDLKQWPSDAWLVIDDYHFAMESKPSEDFLAELLAHTPLQLFATSRDRPSWVTARRLIYGEVLEISQTALSLTHEEAEEVLAGRDMKAVAGIMALADGWPAVIGLAAHAGGSPVTATDLPAELYAYCADELLSSAPPEVQNDLCLLAIPSELSSDFISRFLGDRGYRVTDFASRVGFLSRTSRHRWELHPLLRAFLLRRLVEDEDLLRSDSTLAVGRHLLEESHFDDVFALIEAAGATALLEPLIEAALPEMLLSGRTHTLQKWLTYAGDTGLPAPVLDLVEAELAFREGRASIAMRAAARAAAGGVQESPWLARAWLRAGQAAIFADRLEDAAAYLERARVVAQTPRDVKAVIRTQFTVGVEREDSELDDCLSEFSALIPLSRDEELWLTSASLFRATRFGGIEEALLSGRAAVPLAAGATPFVATSFLHTFAHGLFLTARYAEALTMLNRTLKEARNAGLAFVVPHVAAVKALAAAGLKRSSTALDSIALARRSAADDDAYLAVTASMVEAKVHLTTGRPDIALSVLDADLAPPSMTRVISGEFHSLRALACACLGRSEEASELASLARSITRTIEAQVVAAGADAVVAVRRRSSDAREHAVTVLRTAGEAGNLDSLVTVYRSEPAVLAALGRLPRDEYEFLRQALRRSSDIALAPSDLRDKLSVAEPRPLSPREEQILGLLARGMTNREIAKELFIAEVTVKVHVRHIFEKLGVRSRTEAAVRAARRDYGQ